MIKRWGFHFYILLFITTVYANQTFAGFQVITSKPIEITPTNKQVQQEIVNPTESKVPVVEAQVSPKTHLPETPIQSGQADTGLYAITMSGSVKQNLERIMGRYQWRVVWKAPYDFNFDGKVTGTSLPNVIEKLLKPFPLKAVMYLSNRTLAVVPRTRT